MKILLLLPLLLGFSVPAIAHNEFNGGECGDGGCGPRFYNNAETEEGEEGEGAEPEFHRSGIYSGN